MDGHRSTRLVTIESRIICSIFILMLTFGFDKPLKASASIDQADEPANQVVYVALGSSNLLGVVDRSLHTLIGTVDLSGFGCTSPDRMRFNPGGDQLFILCQTSSKLLVMNVPIVSFAYMVAYLGGNEDDIAFNRDGSRAFISARDRHTIYVLDTGTHEIIQSIPTNDFFVVSLETNPTKDFLYGVGGSYSPDQGRILVIDMNTLSVTTTINFGGDNWGVAVSPDGQRLYTSSSGTGIAVINTSTNEIEQVISYAGDLTGLAISPDGKTLFAGTAYDRSVRVYNLESRSFVTSIPISGTWVRDISIDYCGDDLYIGSMSNYLSVVSTQTYTVDFQIPLLSGTQGAAVFPTQGVCLYPVQQEVTGHQGETVQIIETLRNYTGNSDTFILSLGESDWQATLSDNTVGPLGNGEEATVTVNVTIPKDAEAESTNTVVLTATSTTSAANTDTSRLTIEAYPWYTYFPVITRPIPMMIGKVTMNGSPASGVSLELRFYDGATWSTLNTTATGVDGSFSFLNPPALSPGQQYYIRYLNSTDSNRLSSWYTRVITSFGSNSYVVFNPFDIANVVLSNPESGASVGLPATFSWIPRPATPTDSYEFNLFDPEDGTPWFYNIPPLGYVSSYRLANLPSGFSKGVYYGWFIAIHSPDGGYGESYWYYYVKFK